LASLPLRSNSALSVMIPIRFMPGPIFNCTATFSCVAFARRLSNAEVARSAMNRNPVSSCAGEIFVFFFYFFLAGPEASRERRICIVARADLRVSMPSHRRRPTQTIRAGLSISWRLCGPPFREAVARDDGRTFRGVLRLLVRGIHVSRWREDFRDRRREKLPPDRAAGN